MVIMCIFGRCFILYRAELEQPIILNQNDVRVLLQLKPITSIWKVKNSGQTCNVLPNLHTSCRTCTCYTIILFLGHVSLHWMILIHSSCWNLVTNCLFLSWQQHLDSFPVKILIFFFFNPAILDKKYQSSNVQLYMYTYMYMYHLYRLLSQIMLVSNEKHHCIIHTIHTIHHAEKKRQLHCSPRSICSLQPTLLVSPEYNSDTLILWLIVSTVHIHVLLSDLSQPNCIITNVWYMRITQFILTDHACCTIDCSIKKLFFSSLK